MIDLKIINAKQIITMAKNKNYSNNIEKMNDLGLIENGAIIIENGKIKDIGTTEEIEKKYPNSIKTIDATDKVIMPGFVDSHTHLVFAADRENEFEMRIQGKSYKEISLADGGIRSSVRKLRSMDEETLVKLALIRLDRMLSMGTTSVEIKSGYGLDTENELKSLRVIEKLNNIHPIDIIPTFMGAHDYPDEYRENKNGYIDLLINEMLPAVKEQGIAKFCDIFTEGHVFNIEESRKIMTKAKDLGFHLRFHADEIESMGGAELAAEMGAISADHLLAVSDKGIEELHKANVFAGLLPGTAFSLRTNFAPGRKMIDKGLNVTLSTDCNPGSCNTESMPMIITLACLYMKFTTAEAITAATINGAKSLMIDDITGSLEIGKNADLVIWDMPSYKTLPYHFGVNLTETVIKKGKIVYHKNNF